MREEGLYSQAPCRELVVNKNFKKEKVMVLSNEIIEKMVGTPSSIDPTSAELGIVPGGNIWGFSEGEEIEFKKENYDECKAFMVGNTRVLGEPTAKQLKDGREVTYKYMKTEDGKLLSLGTLLRRNPEGKFHEKSKGLPSAIAISEILDELDGKTVKCVGMDTFEVKVYDQVTRKPKLDEKGVEVTRKQKHYAWEIA